MTAAAGCVGWRKRARGMATLTRHVDVGTVEYKTGTEVVKCLLAMRQYGHDQRDEQQHPSGSEHHCSVLTSVNVLGEWQRPQSGPNSPS